MAVKLNSASADSMGNQRRVWRYSLFVMSVMLVVLAGAARAEAAPNLSCRYYCLIDAGTGQVILSRSADESRQVASTTKMMTAILAEEYADPAEIAVVSREAARTPKYVIGLRSGQEISVKELLKAALIKSANDASVVLAEHVAGDIDLFAHMMSLKAVVIGAHHTHFANPSGLPDSDNFSSAYDLTRIGRYLLEKRDLAALVSTRKTGFQHPGYRSEMIITNTNGLLDTYPGANGIKTGTTNDAGKCLVASATRNGRHLIAVALKSADRTGDCARLLDYGFNDCHLVSVVDRDSVFKEIPIAGGDPPFASVVPARDIRLWQGEESKLNVEKVVRMDYQREAPLKMGQQIGEVRIFTDGNLVAVSPLIVKKKVSRQGFFTGSLKSFF
ncbi:MAG: D-alanyl-D-alanine carboxypeptidase [Syntrophomonadaceae bacterium]|nr:D-alanyl-D-alanine carboxypeptidase [Syntrophomonadaceae bacterium]